MGGFEASFQEYRTGFLARQTQRVTLRRERV